MALPASDSFNRAAPLGANWTQALATVTIASSTVYQASAAADSVAFWNADSFGNNQFSQATIVSVSSSVNYVGIAVRCAVNTGYVFFTDGASGSGHSEISRLSGGTFTTIKAIAATFATNDVIRLEVSGTTLSLYKNAGLVDTATDSNITSGAAGIYGYANGQGDTWSADNLAGGASPTLVQLERSHRGAFRGIR